jgi:tetratricopeptide (TPR) repeat protein
VQRGDLGEALRSFDQAAATTAELLARSPAEGQRVFNHAQNVFWVGEIARQRGDLARAESSFQQYRALASQLLMMDSNNDDWRTEVSYAESALGTLYVQEGRTADARASFERSLGAFTELARRKPSDLNRQFELGQGHAWLADALQKLGRLAEARDHNEAELQIYRVILAKDGTMRQPKFSTVDVLQTLGRLAMLEGNAKGAQDKFKESADRAEALLAGEPENMNTTAVAAIAQVALGEALLAQRQVDGARAAQRRASTLIATALSHDDTVATWRNYRDEGSLLEAKIDADAGQIAEALKLDQAVLSRLSAATGPSANTQLFWLLQCSRLQTGNDLAALDRSQEARTQWTAVVHSLQGPLENYEPRLLEVLAAAQTRLGGTAEAQAVTKRLQSLFRSVAKTEASL